jgi:cytochrome c553
MMKVLTIFAGLIFSIALVADISTGLRDAAAQEGKKPPETIILAKEAKLGPVAFNHLKHITEKRSPDGTKEIACIECHHTAQPASEAVKHPPHKTAWPADRTTTLTMELLAKDPNAVAAICTDCHARADAKAKLLPAIPQVKFEGSAEPTVMTNQQAFHHNCGDCHDQVVKARPSLDPPPPTSKKCMACHKKTAA